MIEFYSLHDELADDGINCPDPLSILDGEGVRG
jgi:hypothetical protein